MNAESVDDYQATRTVAALVSGLGWVVVIIGAIIVIMVLVKVVQRNPYGPLSPFQLLPVSPGFGAIIGGLLLVVVGQMTQAAVDNANHSKQILQVLRQREPASKD